ncbi:ribonuclease H-like protein [Trametopsis cervina]|nr:ribonuclease H-like protein [Trametopsis cervina]
MSNQQTMYPYAQEYSQRSAHERAKSPDTGPGEGIINRKLLFCAALSKLPVEDLITHCDRCRRWYVLCCPDARDWFDNGRACHHYALVFTDGACQGNGSPGARAGIGGVAGSVPLDAVHDERERMGEKRMAPAYRWSVPVDARVDTYPGVLRTSQRTELLAALEALRRVEALQRAGEQAHGTHGQSARKECKAWVIASDSEYVVKGITEWFPTWQRNGWRTCAGKSPANLDLFLKLDAAITSVERRRAVQVGFWHIPRKYNTEADELATAAASRARPILPDPIVISAYVPPDPTVISGYV